MGIIAAVLLPALLLLGIVVAMIRGNQIQGGGSPGRAPSSGASTQRATTPSPKHAEQKRRKYDGVYRTHEPLPGKPDVDFEDKDWDLTLDEPHSPTSSSSSKPASTLRASPSQSAKQSDV